MSGWGFDTQGSEVLRSGDTEHAACHFYSTEGREAPSIKWVYGSEQPCLVDYDNSGILSFPTQ